MKIATYLINLDGSDERLSAISAALQKHGIAFERVPAVDGRQFDVQALDCYQEQEALSYMGRQLVGGEIGCYLSHLECAKRFLASDSDALVVIEDDMQVDINFLPIIENALRWLAQQHPHWEVINYGNQKMKIATPLHSVKEEGQTFALCHAHYFPMTTTGIVWSRSGAQAFVDASGQIFAPVDNFLRHWQTRRNRGYCFAPPLVTTTGSESEIDTGSKRKAHRREWYYYFSKQRRLWVDKFLAAHHKYLGSN